MKLRILLVLACLLSMFCCDGIAAKPLGFTVLGDKPDKTFKIPAGFSEIKITPPAVNAISLYKENGVSFFAHHYQEAIMPDTKFVSVSKKDPSIDILATLGEYEPFTFTIQPKVTINNVKLRMSDLTSLDGEKKILAENVEIRRIDFRPRNSDLPYRLGQTHAIRDKKKYIQVPILLVKENKSKISAGQNRTFWVTVYVPPKTQPGMYNGNVIVEWAGGKIQLPIKLQVLPFKLGQPPIMFGMYYSSGNWYKNWPQLADNELKDLANRGFRSVVSAVNDSAVIRGNEVTVKGNSWWGSFVKRLDAHGINGSLVRSGYFSEPNLFIKHGYDFGRHPDHYKSIVESIYKNVADPQGKLGIPILVAPWDEPDFKGADVMRDAVRDYKLIRNAGGKSYVSAGGPCIGLNTAALFSPEANVVCYNGGGRYLEYSKSAHHNGLDYWYYANGAIPEWCRLAWGVGGWALDSDGITSWAYRSMPPDKSYQELTAHNYGLVRQYTYPSKKGPIPTVAWECVREGMDDYRYLAALENLIVSSQSPQAKDARKFLDKLRANVLNLRSLYGSMMKFHERSDVEYYEKLRSLIAAYILRVKLAADGKSDIANKIKIPVFKGIQIKTGKECIKDRNGISLSSKRKGTGWRVEGTEGVQADVVASPKGKSGRSIRVRITGNKPAKLRLIYDLTKYKKQLAGNTLQLFADIFSKTDLHGFKVKVLQYYYSGKPIPAMASGDEYGNAVSYRTFIPDPGKWVTRHAVGKVHPSANRLELVFETPVLNIRPAEKENEIFIRNISLKPISNASMNVPKVDLSSLANLTVEELLIPEGRNLPYPRKNRFLTKSVKPNVQIRTDEIILSDNVPAMAGQKVRVGISGSGDAALLIDGKHDSRHSLKIPAVQTGSYEFDFNRICNVTRVELRGFQWDKWGYDLSGLEVMVKTTDGQWVTMTEQWNNKTLVENEPWEACSVLKQDKPIACSGLKIKVSKSQHIRYLSELYIYGTTTTPLLVQNRQPNESESVYIVEPSANNAASRVKLHSVTLVAPDLKQSKPELIIDGKRDNRWVLRKASDAVLEFQLAKKSEVNSVDLYLGSVKWSNKAIPRYFRLYYQKAGKWLPWGEPIIGNLALQRSINLPKISTDRIRLELLGSWTRDINVLREVEFFYNKASRARQVSTRSDNSKDSYSSSLRFYSVDGVKIFSEVGWVAYRKCDIPGAYLQTIKPGMAWITGESPLNDEFKLETEVSNVIGQIGGYAFTLSKFEQTGAVGSNSDQDNNKKIASIYFSHNNKNESNRGNKFVLYYYAVDGQIMSVARDGKWKKGFHLSNVEWDGDTKYKLILQRKAGMLAMSVQADGRTLLGPPAVAVSNVRDANGRWDFVLGDKSTKYSQGCMLVQNLKINDKVIALEKLSKVAAVQNMTSDDLPEFGIFKFGSNYGYLQLPQDYTPNKKYPFILFFHGRGGTAVSNNVLTDEYKEFRRQASRRGYILAAPGYGSNSWMNLDGEKITNEMVVFLKQRLSIDHKRFYVMGTSMGGGATLTYAAMNSQKVAAACDIFGISDFVRFYNEGFYNKSIAKAFGGTPKQRPEMYKQRSGTKNIDQLKEVPLLIIHGDKDKVVPIWNSKTLYKKLKQAGGKVQMITARGVGHQNVIIAGNEDKILDFFDKAVRD